MGRYALTDGGFMIDKENLHQSYICTSVVIDNVLYEEYKLSNGGTLKFSFNITKESDDWRDLYEQLDEF